MLSETYIAGESWLHQLPPGRKLLLLFVFSTAIFVLPAPVLWPGAVLILAGYRSAGIPPRHAWAAVRPAWVMLVIIFAVQIWLAGPLHAAYVTSRFIILLLAAGLITLTTRVSEFTDGITALLAPAPDWMPKTQIALAISLVWRFIPMLRTIYNEVHEAQAARGLDRNMTALLVPVMIRVLKAADQIADAIYARSRD